MTSRIWEKLKNAISRVWSFAEKSMTPHWIGNFMEIMMGWFIRVENDFVNWLKLWAIRARYDVIKREKRDISILELN